MGPQVIICSRCNIPVADEDWDDHEAEHGGPTADPVDIAENSIRVDRLVATMEQLRQERDALLKDRHHNDALMKAEAERDEAVSENLRNRQWATAAEKAVTAIAQERDAAQREYADLVTAFNRRGDQLFAAEAEVTRLSTETGVAKYKAERDTALAEVERLKAEVSVGDELEALAKAEAREQLERAEAAEARVTALRAIVGKLCDAHAGSASPGDVDRDLIARARALLGGG